MVLDDKLELVLQDAEYVADPDYLISLSLANALIKEYGMNSNELLDKALKIGFMQGLRKADNER